MILFLHEFLLLATHPASNSGVQYDAAVIVIIVAAKRRVKTLDSDAAMELGQ